MRPIDLAGQVVDVRRRFDKQLIGLREGIVQDRERDRADRVGEQSNAPSRQSRRLVGCACCSRSKRILVSVVHHPFKRPHLGQRDDRREHVRCSLVRLIMSPSELFDSARYRSFCALRQARLATMSSTITGPIKSSWRRVRWTQSARPSHLSKPSVHLLQIVGLSPNAVTSSLRPTRPRREFCDRRILSTEGPTLPIRHRMPKNTPPPP